MSRITRTRIAVATVAALAISLGGPAANAYWQTLGNNPGTAKAGAIAALAVAPKATAEGGATVSWASSTTAGSPAVSGYTVARYSSANGGTMVPARDGCGGTVTETNCTEANLPAGTWYYTVTPKLELWMGPESARSAGVAGDSTPPVISGFTVPTFVNSSNVTGTPVNVTAEAGSSVRITVTDTPPAGTLPQTLSLDLTASGSLQTVSFDLSTFSQGTINYTAVATDAAGNTSVPKSASSIKDTVAPTATVTLVNKGLAGTAEKGDEIRIQFSKPMSLPSICSTWIDGQQPSEISAKDDVVVSITGTNLSVSRTLAGCALNIGTVSLGASYANSGTLTFEGSGSNVSKIAWNQNSQTLTITLGQRNGSAKTSVGESVPTVVPPTGVKDLAGNQAVSAATAGASRF